MASYFLAIFNLPIPIQKLKLYKPIHVFSQTKFIVYEQVLFKRHYNLEDSFYPRFQLSNIIQCDWTKIIELELDAKLGNILAIKSKYYLLDLIARLCM